MSNKEFLEVFGTGEHAPVPEREDLYGIIKKYLEGKRNPSAIRIRSWLNKGGLMDAFTCRADTVLPVMEAFRESRIPYIVVEEPGGDIGFLIRQSDSDGAKRAVRTAMKAMAKTCAIMDGKAAESYYLQSNNEDKMMIQVAGLTQEEVLYLAEAAARAMPGEAVGIDALSDGTYLFSCHGKTAMSARGKHTFGEALTETMLLLNGESADSIRQATQERAKYLKAKTEGFPDRTGYSTDPVWTVGRGSRYVKKSADGFELGHAVTDREWGVDLVPDLFVGTGERRYEERLESALLKITGHTCLYSEEEAIDWFRTKRSYFSRQAVAGQQTLAMRADAMVAKKIEGDRVMQMDGRWDAKLRHYEKEMGKLLGALKSGRVPKGYRREDIGELKRIAQAFRLSTGRLEPAISRTASISVYGREAGPGRIADVQKHIERMTARAGGHGEDVSRSRTQSTDRRGENR